MKYNVYAKECVGSEPFENDDLFGSFDGLTEAYEYVGKVRGWEPEYKILLTKEETIEVFE